MSTEHSTTLLLCSIGNGTSRLSHRHQQSSFNLFHFAHLFCQIHDADLVLDIPLSLCVPRPLGRLVVLLSFHYVRLIVLIVNHLFVGHGPSHFLKVFGRSQAFQIPLPKWHEVRLPVNGRHLFGVHVRIVLQWAHLLVQVVCGCWFGRQAIRPPAAAAESPTTASFCFTKNSTEIRVPARQNDTIL